MDSSAAAAAVVSVIHGSSKCLFEGFKRIPVLLLIKSAKVAHVKTQESDSQMMMSCVS